MTDFEKIVRLFSEAGIDCVIVGGLAATIHGSARLTQDVDFVYARDRANIGRLVAALKPYSPYLRGAPPGLPFEWSEATIERGLNFTLTTALGDIDLLGEITGGGDYPALLPHSGDVEMFGCRCRCLDLPGLIRVKRAAGRPKDRRAGDPWAVPAWKRGRTGSSAGSGRRRGRGCSPSRAERRIDSDGAVTE